MTRVIYFSARSGNTARFVDALGLPSARLPATSAQALPRPKEPYVLVCPTYADAEGRGAVPKPVIRFLNDPDNRGLLDGVIAGGNRNFGATFALAGEVISRKCQVPVLYRFELAGTSTDVTRVQTGLKQRWEEQCLTT